jgi:AraC-like DNA-binding protein
MKQVEIKMHWLRDGLDRPPSDHRIGSGLPPAETAAPSVANGPLDNLKLTHIRSLDDLETGAYWPRLQPYFLEPHYKRLTYRLTTRATHEIVPNDVLSTRGAARLGELDVAYVSDRYATAMSITETGLPDYCLTSVNSGGIAFRGGDAVRPIEASERIGLIYRGVPGTRVAATDAQRRLAIWIRAYGLQQRLAALLGEPGREDIVFEPVIRWDSDQGRGLARLISLMTEEIGSPNSFAANELASRSFTDLLLYALLNSLRHNYSDRLDRAANAPAPRSVHRAEDFMHAHAGLAIGMQDIADAAGCSVRSLQLAFRRFRDTTPIAALRQIRLEAVRQVLQSGEARRTVTDVAYQFGFTNPGRFSRMYKQTFGVYPGDVLRRNISRRLG